MNLRTGKELFSQKQGAEVKGYRVKGHYTFGTRVQPEAAGLAGEDLAPLPPVICLGS